MWNVSENKSVKFQSKIPNGGWEMTEKTLGGYFILPHPVGSRCMWNKGHKASLLMIPKDASMKIKRNKTAYIRKQIYTELKLSQEQSSKMFADPQLNTK